MKLIIRSRSIKHPGCRQHAVRVEATVLEVIAHRANGRQLMAVIGDSEKNRLISAGVDVTHGLRVMRIDNPQVPLPRLAVGQRWCMNESYALGAKS